MTKSTPQISVISPYAGEHSLKHFLDSIVQQTLAPDLFEVLIIEDSRESGGDIADEYGTIINLRRIPLNRPPDFSGHTAGLCRNLGVRLARSDKFVFIDSDCIVHPDCLRLHFQILRERENAAVCGAAKELPIYNKYLLEASPGVTYEELAGASLPDYRLSAADDPTNLTPPTGDGWDFWFSVNASVTRPAFEKAGRFSELGYRCHDLDLAYRLFKSDVQFEYSESAEVIHVEHPRSINFRKQQMNGWLHLGKQHPELAAYVEDRLIVAKQNIEQILERCENKFQQITQGLPGIRTGYSWLLPPGKTEEDLASRLAYVSYVSREHKDNKYLNLRLHKNCWDYTFILPGSSDPPSVSVIIPAYNAEDTIVRAVQSILLQTCQSFELLIIDDASEDDTLEELAPYQNDPRIRVFSLRHNGGLSNALNVGLMKSRTPFIVQLDADDWLEPNTLETVLNVLQKDDSIGALYGDAIIHHSNGKVSVTSGRQLSNSIEFFECSVPQVPRAYRRSALFDVGGWSTSDAYFGRYYDDRLILAKIWDKYQVVWIPEKLYHVAAGADSLSRKKPVNFMAGKLAILWEQANARGYSFTYTFDGEYLRAKFHPRSKIPANFGWSVIIPFHRSIEQLRISVKSWLESDLLSTEGEIIIVDQTSGKDMKEVVSLDPERIRVIFTGGRKSVSRARNLGAAAARQKMLFFCDADYIVPPDVLSCHEKYYLPGAEDTIVIGAVFGRRTFLSIDPGCRPEHRQRILDFLKFDERFEQVAGTLACGQHTTLLDVNSNKKIWESARKFSLADPWYGDWARIFLMYDYSLDEFPHRWTRVNTGNMSVKAETLKRLGGFDENLLSMEDWELGAMAQKNGVRIIAAPEAEPYHQIHPVDTDRPDNDRKAASYLASKHPDLTKKLLNGSGKISPPAAQSINYLLSRKNSQNVDSKSKNESPPAKFRRGYCVFTFDDGPHPVGTPLILETLARFDFKATFFFLGAEAQKYGEICREASRLGHEIGIHGWTHTPVNKLTTVENIEWLKRTLDIVGEAAGRDIRYVRPPYGKLNVSFVAAAKKLDLEIVGWDVSSDDWLAISKKDIIRNLASAGIKNKVLLFHDAAGDPSITAEALGWLFETCRSFNVKPISLQECSGFRNLPSLKPMEIERWVEG